MGKIQRVIFKAMLCSVLALLSYAQFATAASDKCESLFEKLNPEIQNKIEDTIKNLAELKITIDQAKAQGANSIEITALTENFKNKNAELFKYVRKNNLMTKDQYVNQLRQTIVDLQKEKEQAYKETSEKRKEEASTRNIQKEHFSKTEIDGSKLIMQRVEPGPFKKGEARNLVDKVISEPFEMSATQTTQIVWKKVIELAHTKLGNKYLELKKDPSRFTGDTRPVENVSYNDIVLWIKALNELSQSGDLSLVEIIPDHKAGDIYRLPTSDEWEFVVRGRGQLNEVYHFGNDVDEVKIYAHYGSGTQPVAQLRPLVVDDKKFYDMLGNVWELTSTIAGMSDQWRAVRGGGWNLEAVNLRSGYEVTIISFALGPNTGFRLVKDLGANP